MLRKVLFFGIVFFSFLALNGLLNAQENLLTEKETIKTIIVKEATTWANRDFESWASTWHQNDDIIAVFVSATGYNETIGWENLSANVKQQFNNSSEPIRERIVRDNFVVRVDGNIAWATYKQFRITEDSRKKTRSREMRSLIKNAGQWRLTSLTTIYDASFEPSLTGIENSINTSGYQFLSLGKLNEAIAVFQMNVALFPDSWNVYDSLGEAYLMAGNRALAIANYSRSVQLNPNNENGAVILEKLMQENESPNGVRNESLCEKFVGEYVTNDRAFQVRNELQQQGYEAWIKHWGSFLSGTRTYAVFAMLPCE